MTETSRILFSWESLDQTPIRAGQLVSDAFLVFGVVDYQTAGRFVERLPYGRNTRHSALLAVLEEGRGTCSTKHGLMRRLAIEQNLDVKLLLGIYEMNGQNTPGVGPVLSRYGLTSLPEAHCYLGAAGKRIDITRSRNGGPKHPIERFLHEEEISPAQIGDYKTELHQRFMRQWLEARRIQLSFDELWRAREQCIVTLADAGIPSAGR